MGSLLRRAGIAALLAALAVSSAGGAGKRSITETDLLDFHWIADPQISPDGSRIAFVKVDVNRKADRYDTEIWLASAGGAGAAPPRRITAGPRDLAPRWSPDGSQLAFLRAPERDGKPQPPQVHLLSMSGGGEATALTDLPRGAGTPEWAPDGRTLLFTTTTTAEDLAKKETKKPAGDADAPRESDVRVITRAVYRANGSGYNDPKRRSHVWTV